MARHMGLLDGAPIAKYPDPTDALLVIDVQKDLTSPGGMALINPSLTDPMISDINQVIDRAQADDRLVVYIRHEFEDGFLVDLFTGGALKQGALGAEIDPRVHIVSTSWSSKKVRAWSS
jgi:nicotinamidase-related amidase